MEEGYLASHVTDKTGCGSAEIPWLIQRKVGETIRITLLDFGAIMRHEQEKPQDSNCPVVYGYILERSLAINKTLCGSTERRHIVYESSANYIEIHIIPSHKRQNGDQFLLHLKSEFTNHSLIHSLTHSLTHSPMLVQVLNNRNTSSLVC